MGTLRRIAVMAGAGAVRTFRSPMDVLWILIVPVAFSLVIGSFFSTGAEERAAVHIVDEDVSDWSRAFVAGMQQRGYEVTLTTRAEAAAQMSRGTHNLAIVLPNGFGDSIASGAPALEIVYGPGYAVGDEEVSAKAVARALADGGPVFGPPVVQQSPRGEDADDGFPKTRSIFGVYMMFLWAALLARGGAFHEAREDGTLERVVATGVPYAEVVAAHAVGLALVGLTQSAVILGITGILGTQWLAGGFLVLAVAVIGTLFVAAGLSIGVSGMSSSIAVIQTLTGGLPVLLAMTGGAFFPLDAAPAAMQQLTRINPAYWAMRSLEDGLVLGGVQAQLVPLSVLVLIGVLGMVVGIQRLQRMQF